MRYYVIEAEYKVTAIAYSDRFMIITGIQSSRESLI